MHSDLSALEIIESFYIETQEGLFFAVKGFVHPPDRVVGVLRYVPDAEQGERIKGGEAYRRLYHFPEQEQLLQSTFPEYLQYDPVFQVRLQSVPRSCVHRVYDPRVRAVELSETQQFEPVLAEAADFISVLKLRADVPISAIGISGSILIGMQRATSDLDISVFGMQSCWKVYRALASLLESESVSDLRHLDESGIVELYAQRAPDTQMEFGAFAELERKKVCQGSFKNRPYFIRFLKEPCEMDEEYGDIRYCPIGRATIEARVDDDQDAIFTPCRYLVSEVQTLEGPDMAIDEIVSFRGRFCEQARVGDYISAAGMIERVEREGCRIRHRLLLGNAPNDTMTRRKPA
jgi:predicted nucleotidyltransferase